MRKYVLLVGLIVVVFGLVFMKFEKSPKILSPKDISRAEAYSLVMDQKDSVSISMSSQTDATRAAGEKFTQHFETFNEAPVNYGDVLQGVDTELKWGTCGSEDTDYFGCQYRHLNPDG